MASWKITIREARPAVEAALAAQESAVDWDDTIVLTGYEADPKSPEDWVLDAYLQRKPTRADIGRVERLFDSPAVEPVVEKLLDEDWVTLSQQGVEPITAGPFHVRTPDHPAPGDDSIGFVIPASQAFGTGQHETTAGCLAMLAEMRARGVVARNLADIGTGTGLLAFGAMALWPAASATASDIDPVCLPVVLDNCAANSVPIGHAKGELLMLVADGMHDPMIASRGPFDLIVANILAAPLIEMANEIAMHVSQGGNLVLAGLLVDQEAAVRAAYRRAGFRLAGRIRNGDWSILWLRRRRRT